MSGDRKHGRGSRKPGAYNGNGKQRNHVKKRPDPKLYDANGKMRRPLSFGDTTGGPEIPAGFGHVAQIMVHTKDKRGRCRFDIDADAATLTTSLKPHLRARVLDPNPRTREQLERLKTDRKKLGVS